MARYLSEGSYSSANAKADAISIASTSRQTRIFFISCSSISYFDANCAERFTAAVSLQQLHSHYSTHSNSVQLFKCRQALISVNFVSLNLIFIIFMTCLSVLLLFISIPEYVLYFFRFDVILKTAPHNATYCIRVCIHRPTADPFFHQNL